MIPLSIIKRPRKAILIFLIGITIYYIYFMKNNSIEENRIRINQKREISHSPEVTCPIPTLKVNDPLDLMLDQETFATIGLNKSPDCVGDNSTKFSVDLESNLIRNDPESEFWQKSKCFLQSYTRYFDLPDVAYKMRKIRKITEDVTNIENEMELISLWCYNSSPNSTKKIIYQDAFFHVPKTPPPLFDSRLNGASNNSNPSVLMLLIDGVSQVGFIRHMPKSYQFLMSNLSAISFTGYNAFDHFSTENMLPLLSGLTFKEAREYFNWETWRPVDKIPFLWQHFKSRGYVTSYSDECQYYIFPFLRKQFDWDFRDILTPGKDKGPKIGHEHVIHSIGCFGSRLAFDIHLDLMVKLAYRYKNQPYFYMTWSHTLSHDVSQYIQYTDDSLVSMLGQLVTRNLLNNTILIILSDHGPRYGDLRQKSPQGYLEERLPMLFISLPPKFRKAHPQAVKNLEENSDKWITAMDLHMTLKNVVSMSRLNQTTDATRMGSSLWKKLPKNRNCDHFPGMQAAFCICWQRQPVDRTDKAVTEAAQFVLGLVHQNKVDELDCTQLRIDGEVLWATVRGPGESGGDHGDVNCSAEDKFYEFEFRTIPGSGHFFCHVQWQAKKKKWRKLFMSRLSERDSYHNCSFPTLTRMM